MGKSGISQKWEKSRAHVLRAQSSKISPLYLDNHWAVFHIRHFHIFNYGIPRFVEFCHMSRQIDALGAFVNEVLVKMSYIIPWLFAPETVVLAAWQRSVSHLACWRCQQVSHLTSHCQPVTKNMWQLSLVLTLMHNSICYCLYKTGWAMNSHTIDHFQLHQ